MSEQPTEQELEDKKLEHLPFLDELNRLRDSMYPDPSVDWTEAGTTALSNSMMRRF